MQHLSQYFANLNNAYCEQIYTNSMYQLKLLVPSDHKNLNLLFNKFELDEFKQLLQKNIEKQSKIKLLNDHIINFKPLTIKFYT